MTLPRTNFTKSYKNSGVTLIECLVVLTILASLIAAVGTSFTMSLKSYVGEYASEAVELESQRAALELEYFASRAVDVRIMPVAGLSGTSGYESGVLGGRRVELLQPNGNTIAFEYQVTGSTVDSAGRTTQVGNLGIDMLGEDYYYSTNVWFTPITGWVYPFQVSNEGGLSFRWSVPTPTAGEIKVGGSVSPGI